MDEFDIECLLLFDTGNKRYLVLYYLHGASGNQNEFYDFRGSTTADRLLRAGSIEEMIVVGVDASGGQPISSYVNSELNGNYDDYIVQDLVQHIDSVFRTIPDRDSLQGKYDPGRELLLSNRDADGR